MQASPATVSLTLFVVWLGSFLIVRHLYSLKRLLIPFHEDITALGVLALMLAGFFWRTIFEGDVFVPAGGGDLAAFLYPTFAFAASSIKQGILPLWNPYLYSGSPFAADIQSGLFYPVNLVAFLLLPEISYKTMEFLAVLHFYIAGITMYFCLRFLRTGSDRQVGRAGAMIGAIAYMFSDVFIVHLGNLNMIAVAAWLPLVFLFFHRGLVEKSLPNGAMAGLFLGVALLAGHIQPFLYILLCLALYFVFYVVADRLRVSGDRGQGSGVESSTQNPNTGPRPLSPVPRQAAVFAVCGLVALGVSAIQLIPSYELSQLSVRADIDYATSVQYSLSPAQLVSLFVPGFFGRGPLDYWGPWVRTEMGYAGVLTLVAGLVAIVLRRQRETLFFLLLAIVSLSLSLGGHSLTQGWLYSLGAGFDKLRAPARFLFLFDFALAALAGLGIDQMLRPLTHGEKMSLRGIARYVTFFAVVVAAGALPPFLYFLFDTIGAGGGPTVARLTGIVEGIALFLLLLAGCVALLWARVKDWIGPAVLGGLAVAWMGFDLMTTGFNVEVGTKDPTGNFQHPGVINFLKQDKSLYRVDSVTDVWDVWQPDTTLLNGIPDIWGVYNPMISADLDNYWAKLGSRSSPLYDLMNAKYLIGHKGVPLAKKFELVYDDDPQVSVFRNSKALPRAFVVYSADVISDKDQAFEAIHDKTFDPTQKVIVEGGQPITSTILNSSVVFTAYSANEMVIKASAAAPAYLVLSEVYNDGWKAIVDGQPQKILRADYLFRAIPLPAGDHEVRLVFDPTSFRQGATLTGLTWAVLAGATGIGLLRRRQRPKSRQNLP